MCVNYSIWLDDLRPIEKGFDTLVKSYEDFVAIILSKGLPDKISFDHDLGHNLGTRERTGYDCAKWLVEYCIKNDLELPLWKVHSQNPIGAENIRKYLENFEDFEKRYESRTL